jgi:hypothetical protein
VNLFGDAQKVFALEDLAAMFGSVDGLDCS